MDVTDVAPETLDAVVSFHGHLCPGLLIGYRAALLALDTLEVGPAADEDLVLIVENDSCSVDALQFLLSTTFGKGNLVFLDHGKQVFTVGDRTRGRAVRIALRHDAFQPSDPGAPAPTREERISVLLSAPAERLFHVNPVGIQLPARAEVRPSVRCTRCREGVMETKTVASDEGPVCRPCARDLGFDT